MSISRSFTLFKSSGVVMHTSHPQNNKYQVSHKYSFLSW